jgi:hypothetical protein
MGARSLSRKLRLSCTISVAQMVQQFAFGFITVDTVWARGDPTREGDVECLRAAVQRLLRAILDITCVIGVDPRNMKVCESPRHSRQANHSMMPLVCVV